MAANGPEVKKAMIAAGYAPAVIDLVTRRLAAAGLWMQTPRGRIGPDAPQAEVRYLTNLGLGLAARNPIDAPQAVATLRALVPAETVTSTIAAGMFGFDSVMREEVNAWSGKGPPTLGDFLDSIIQWLADQSSSKREALELDLVERHRFELSLSPAGDGLAILSQQRSETSFERTAYRPAQIALPAKLLPEEARRHALAKAIMPRNRTIRDDGHRYVLDPLFFFVAADLLADEPSQHADDLFPSSPSLPASGNVEDGNGSSPAGAEPKTENGAKEAPARASTTPSNTGVQPRANGANYSHSAENRETEAKSQGLSSRGRLDTPPQPISRRRRPGVSDHAYAIP